MSPMNLPQIMDVTLRDGSYVLHFQFTAADTTALCRELEDAGIELIEVGHGIGLGASESGMGQAAETDEEYMRAAAETLTKARWGMFCIPGIATLDQIDTAADHGMHFVRIGTNVTEVEESEPYVTRARERGMLVTANFMKSYAMPPEAFAEKAALSQKFGSQIVYIVDSAGGMLPNEMSGYFHAVQDACDVEIGFHGHDNLGLAVANSLIALELGAVIVDTSLQGIGRSAGNTSTEIFAAVLDRLGKNPGIDLLKAMDVGEKYIRPLLQVVGHDSVDVVSGFSQFHSSYMTVIREFSTRYQIDPRRLIIALCEKNKVEAPRELVEELALRISEETDEVFAARFPLHRYVGAEQDPRDS